MMEHNFTKAIEGSISRSSEEHLKYREKTEVIIREQNMDLKHDLDNLQVNYNKMLRIPSEKIVI